MQLIRSIYNVSLIKHIKFIEKFQANTINYLFCFCET